MSTTADGIKITYTREIVLPEGVATEAAIEAAVAGASAGAIHSTLKDKLNFFTHGKALSCTESVTTSLVTITTTITPKL